VKFVTVECKELPELSRTIALIEEAALSTNGGGGSLNLKYSLSVSSENTAFLEYS
jgi:hypothetical protein